MYADPKRTPLVQAVGYLLMILRVLCALRGDITTFHLHFSSAFSIFIQRCPVLNQNMILAR